MNTPDRVPDPVLGEVSAKMAANPDIRRAVQNVVLKRTIDGTIQNADAQTYLDKGIEDAQASAHGTEQEGGIE